MQLNLLASSPTIKCTFQAQYVFLHHVMLEALVLGDVIIPASVKFADEYQRLTHPQRPDKKSLIERQFEVSTACEVSIAEKQNVQHTILYELSSSVTRYRPIVFI